MAGIAPRPQMTPEEFLAWEREQPEKHEFYRGEVFAMAGASPRHNALSTRIASALDGALRARGCTVLNSDQRVGLVDRYVYPDVSVVCGKLELASNDVLLNPGVLVEILSMSTEQNDRGSKWSDYQRLASLTDYVLVSQWVARIEHYQRALDGSWTYRAAGAGERIVISSCTVLVVDDLFAGVFELPGDDMSSGQIATPR